MSIMKEKKGNKEKEKRSTEEEGEVEEKNGKGSMWIIHMSARSKAVRDGCISLKALDPYDLERQVWYMTFIIHSFHTVLPKHYFYFLTSYFIFTWIIF